MTRTESEIIFVVIQYSTTMLGNILEWDAIEELKMIGIKKVDHFTGAGMEYIHTGYRVSEGTLSHRCKYPRESKALRGQQFRLLNVLLLVFDVPEMTHALSGIYDE
ncbi:10522_t:CDS:2 [Gigaspora margarita]|uniref:10522_t:CDS:1 n=1 Tax=Gigaspora margarita TaxID=4874 RepID=A0ABN7W817_GIGMA|nr:10522_t:CDS:2 [Gigaspora margarita]